MISLRQFLSEKWKVEDYTSKRTGRQLFASNFKKIDNQNVRVDFTGNADKHFGASYMVGDRDTNMSYYRDPKMPKETGREITKHIGRSIHTFVRHMKPRSITFSSKEDRKIALHAQLTKHLARHFGGKALPPEYGPELTHHKVEFDR